MSELSITIEETAVAARHCGSCTLCCKLVPVASLQKRANERCQHQRQSKGCAIYRTRPLECRMWTCRWLVDEGTTKLRRPDQVHYVIDVMQDDLHVTTDEGKTVLLPSIQVWVDPAFPEAWRDPELQRYVEMVAEKLGLAAIIRLGNERGIALFAPCFDPQSRGTWLVRDLGKPNPAIGRYSQLPDSLRPPL